MPPDTDIRGGQRDRHHDASRGRTGSSFHVGEGVGAARRPAARLSPTPCSSGARAQHAAKQVCVGCPVIAECLADSLDNRTEFGVWGGMTERQRRALLKRRPDVMSWRALFEADRTRAAAPRLLKRLRGRVRFFPD